MEDMNEQLRTPSTERRVQGLEGLVSCLEGSMELPERFFDVHRSLKRQIGNKDIQDPRTWLEAIDFGEDAPERIRFDNMVIEPQKISVIDENSSRSDKVQAHALTVAKLKLVQREAPEAYATLKSRTGRALRIAEEALEDAYDLKRPVAKSLLETPIADWNKLSPAQKAMAVPATVTLASIVLSACSPVSVPSFEVSSAVINARAERSQAQVAQIVRETPDSSKKAEGIKVEESVLGGDKPVDLSEASNFEENKERRFATMQEAKEFLEGEEGAMWEVGNPVEAAKVFPWVSDEVWQMFSSLETIGENGHFVYLTPHSEGGKYTVFGIENIGKDIVIQYIDKDGEPRRVSYNGPFAMRDFLGSNFNIFFENYVMAFPGLSYNDGDCQNKFRDTGQGTSDGFACSIDGKKGFYFQAQNSSPHGSE